MALVRGDGNNRKRKPANRGRKVKARSLFRRGLVIGLAAGVVLASAGGASTSGGVTGGPAACVVVKVSP